jgi:hypothetical protein
MSRKLLISLLVISLLFELILTAVCFFAPATALRNIGSSLNNGTALPGYVIAWFCLFVSIVCGLSLWQVVSNKSTYPTLCYLLGAWWVGIGIGIFVFSGKTGNLITNSLKGLLLIALTFGQSEHKRK